MLGCAAWLRWRLWRRPIMNPRRFATVAPALCGTVVLAGWIVGWLAGFGSAGIKNTGAVPIENRAASLAANARLADEPQAIPMAMGSAVVANTVVANAAVASAEVDNGVRDRSEEHTSELQSRQYLVCRLLLEKKKNNKNHT